MTAFFVRKTTEPHDATAHCLHCDFRMDGLTKAQAVEVLELHGKSCESIVVELFGNPVTMPRRIADALRDALAGRISQKDLDELPPRFDCAQRVDLIDEGPM
jgi:hypothetical protein